MLPIEHGVGGEKQVGCDRAFHDISTGALVDFGERTSGGRALAIIDVEDDMTPYQIPLGAAGQVAIYTEHWHHVSLIRKILLRMRGWQNYVFLEGH